MQTTLIKRYKQSMDAVVTDAQIYLKVFSLKKRIKDHIIQQSAKYLYDLEPAHADNTHQEIQTMISIVIDAHDESMKIDSTD